jgi:hypothetical protein
MPYQVRAGSVTAIVANEQQALEMLRRLGPDRGKVFIEDIFGDEVELSTLEARLKGAEPTQL